MREGAVVYRKKKKILAKAEGHQVTQKGRRKAWGCRFQEMGKGDLIPEGQLAGNTASKCTGSRPTKKEGICERQQACGTKQQKKRNTLNLMEGKSDREN